MKVIYNWVFVILALTVSLMMSASPSRDFPGDGPARKSVSGTVTLRTSPAFFTPL